MTHLKIELNNGVIEEVSSAVISKLYDIVHSGNLDNTSNLIGRLHTSATYQDYIDYLEDTFKVGDVKLLIIDATKKYIRFADPEVLRVLISKYGDGIGIQRSDLEGVSILSYGCFDGNTTIETFDELGLFPSVVSLNSDTFRYCSNLKSVDLSNITTFLGGNIFAGCTNLGSTNSGILNLPKLNSLGNGNGILLGCTSLVEVNIGSLLLNVERITELSGNLFSGCTNLEKVTGLNMVLHIKGDAFYNCFKLESIDTTSNLTTLDSECFFGCTSLQCIDLSSITTLNNNGLFRDCTNLVDLSTNDLTQINTGAHTYTFNWSTIPNQIFWSCKLTNKSFSFPNATSIGNRSFNLSNVVSVSAPNATTAGPYGFYACHSLQSVDFPNLIETTVEDGMHSNELFRECTSLEYLYFPSLTTTSLSMQCWGCTNLKLYIAPNLTDIGRIVNFCGNCTNLKGIFIPKASVGDMTIDLWHWDSGIIGGASNLKVFDVGNVTAINNFTVYGKTSMAFIIRNSTTIPTLSNETDLSFLNVTFYVDDNLLSTYQADSAWSNSNIHLDVISNFVLSNYFDSNTLALYNSIVNPS